MLWPSCWHSKYLLSYLVSTLGRSLIWLRMATNLPRPLNTVLTLFLPPSFEQKQENTLAYILKQGDLTWERLVVGLSVCTAS